MKCTKPVTLEKGIDRREYPDGLRVPCGKCTQCRKQKSGEWALRLTHELDSWDYAIFVTLTYPGDFHYPQAYSLEKNHLQLFFKRLRKLIEPKKIKYYACGEYGSRTKRPHYHAIIFGLGFKDKQDIMDAWNINDWKSKIVKRKSFGIAERKSIRYVTNYINKKWSGPLADQEYKKKGREPVFKIQSNGLGLKFAEKFSEQIKYYGEVRLDGKSYSLPRYYVQKLGIDLTELKNKAYALETDQIYKRTGLNYSRDEVYKLLKPSDVIKLEQGIKQSKQQHDENLKAREKLYDRDIN